MGDRGSFYLQGSVEEELNFDMRDLLKEDCSIAGVFNIPNASHALYNTLSFLRHRGNEGSGIVTEHDGEFHPQKKIGKLTNDFPYKSQIGDNGLAHGRYSIIGAYDSEKNIFPIYINSKFGKLALGHNGTMDNIDGIKQWLVEKGVIFETDTDSEVFIRLIDMAPEGDIEDAIKRATKKIDMAYSFVIMTEDKIIALRDKYGIRPLHVAKLGSGYIVASEDFPFEQMDGCEHIRTLEPGEMIVFEKDKPDFQSIQYVEPDEHFCIFEGMYFSSPRSSYRGVYHEDFRRLLGKKIVEENPDLQGDIVVPIMSSGKHSAEGFAQSSGIEYVEALMRVHNLPDTNDRAFMAPTKEERYSSAYHKLHLRKDLVKGKSVISIDDTIVRGTAQEINNTKLREAGAKEITNVIAAPPIVNTCNGGIDILDENELLAYAKTIDEIRKKVGADKLLYLTLQGLQQVNSETYNVGICSGCFGGKYPKPRK